MEGYRAYVFVVFTVMHLAVVFVVFTPYASTHMGSLRIVEFQVPCSVPNRPVRPSSGEDGTDYGL